MIIAKIIMNALPEKRKEVLGTLLSILKNLLKAFEVPKQEKEQEKENDLFSM